MLMLKEWIAELVREFIAWLAFFREMGRRLGQVADAISVVERDIEAIFDAAIAARVPAEFN